MSRREIAQSRRVSIDRMSQSLERTSPGSRPFRYNDFELQRTVDLTDINAMGTHGGVTVCPLLRNLRPAIAC
jgi:hypothetical protein